MLKWLAAVAALLTVAGCDEPRMSASGRLMASCATPADTTTTPATAPGTSSHDTEPVQGYAGPCYDGTDRTDRTDRTDLTDRTDRALRDDITDRTDRTIRDDVTDRTVWCVEPAMIITAPSFIVFFDFDKSDLTPAAQDTIRQAPRPPTRPRAARRSRRAAIPIARARKRTTWLCRCAARTGGQGRNWSAMVSRRRTSPSWHSAKKPADGPDGRRCARSAEPPGRDRHPLEG